jgi:hypothetical protein
MRLKHELRDLSCFVCAELVERIRYRAASVHHIACGLLLINRCGSRLAGAFTCCMPRTQGSAELTNGRMGVGLSVLPVGICEMFLR